LNYTTEKGFKALVPECVVVAVEHQGAVIRRGGVGGGRYLGGLVLAAVHSPAHAHLVAMLLNIFSPSSLAFWEHKLKYLTFIQGNYLKGEAISHLCFNALSVTFFLITSDNPSI
jgi:hypothetical protein